LNIRLALTGFGSVGKGFAELLQQFGEQYEREYGARLVLTGVADRGGAVVNPEGLDPTVLLEAKQRYLTVSGAHLGEPGLEGREFLQKTQANVLLEAASTNFEDAEPGWGYAREALGLGMDVVLASKGSLVLHYQELMEMARKQDARVLFSGAVGAPLPILELADRALIGAGLQGFEAILNGTSNQVLEAMSEGSTYEEGVTIAQEIGVAETDPTLDVDGWDAAAKAVILANALFGVHVGLQDVAREGIREVTASELKEAARDGSRIKLIVRMSKTAGGVQASVGPEKRSQLDVLGRLRGIELGIVFKTKLLGDVTSTIQDAGGVPTALTVVRDVFNLARDRGWVSQL
jgi:homoserine dehydrogenase